MSRDTDHLACCLVAELAALVKDRELRAHLVAPAVQVDQAANSLDLREVQATVEALAASLPVLKTLPTQRPEADQNQGLDTVCHGPGYAVALLTIDVSLDGGGQPRPASCLRSWSRSAT